MTLRKACCVFRYDWVRLPATEKLWQVQDVIDSEPEGRNVTLVLSRRYGAEQARVSVPVGQRLEVYSDDEV